MLRTTVGLIVGGSVGLVAGFALGRLAVGMIGGSMFGIAGALLGAFAGCTATLIWPGRPDGPDEAADYDDRPRTTG